MDPTGIIGIIACGCKALKLTYDELIKYEVGIKTSDEKIIEDLKQLHTDYVLYDKKSQKHIRDLIKKFLDSEMFKNMTRSNSSAGISDVTAINNVINERGSSSECRRASDEVKSASLTQGMIDIIHFHYSSAHKEDLYAKKGTSTSLGTIDAHFIYNNNMVFVKKCFSCIKKHNSRIITFDVKL